MPKRNKSVKRVLRPLSTRVLRPLSTRVLRSMRHSPTRVLRSMRPSPTRVLRSMRPSPTRVLRSIHPSLLRFLRSMHPSLIRGLRSTYPSLTRVLRSIHPSSTRVLRSVHPSSTRVLRSMRPSSTRILPVIDISDTENDENDESETSEAETSEAETSEVETSEAEPSEAEPSEAETSEAETSESEVIENDASETIESEVIENNESETIESEVTENDEPEDLESEVDASSEAIDDEYISAKLYTHDGTLTTFQKRNAVYVKLDRYIEPLVLFIGSVVCVQYSDSIGRSHYAPAVIDSFTDSGDKVYVRYLRMDITTVSKELQNTTVQHIVSMHCIRWRVDTMTQVMTRCHMKDYTRSLYAQMQTYQETFFHDGPRGTIASLDFHHDVLLASLFGREMLCAFRSMGLLSFGVHDRSDMAMPVLRHSTMTMSPIPLVIDICDACRCRRSLTWSLDIEGHREGYRIGRECMGKMKTLETLGINFQGFRTRPYSRSSFSIMTDKVTDILADFAQEP